VAWSPRAPQSGDPRPAHQAGDGPASRSLTSPNPNPNPAPSADGLTDRERRRLVFLRELVRRGAYNEGFAPGRLPDQYRPPAGGPSEPAE
jgi:hypothetical protein